MHRAFDIAETSRHATRQERIAALREAMGRLQAVPAWAGQAEEPGHRRRVGLDAPECGLPAALPSGALNELVAEHADRPAAIGFMFALATLCLDRLAGAAIFVAHRRVLAELGSPYGHGLAQLGLDVDRLILVETQSDKDALWAIEEALRSEAQPAVVAGAVAAGIDLTSSRRLNLAAAPQQTPLLLLTGTPVGARPSAPGSLTPAAGANAAVTRWRIAAAPAARDRFGAFVHPRWHIALERCRMGGRQDNPAGRPMLRPGAWLIEWNHVAHRFRVVAGLADRAPAAGAGPDSGQASGSGPGLRHAG